MIIIQYQHMKDTIDNLTASTLNWHLQDSCKFHVSAEPRLYFISKSRRYLMRHSDPECVKYFKQDAIAWNIVLK